MEHATDPNVSHGNAQASNGATGAVTFDLAHGQVRLSGGADSGRSALVPVAVLRVLLGAAGDEAAASAGRSLGASLGQRLSARAGDARPAGLDAVVLELATEFALAGLGVLSLERWGKALVVRLDDAPLAGASADAFLAGVVEGLFAAVGQREVRAVALGRDGTVARYLVANAATAARAAELVANNTPWGDVLVRLHAKEAR